MHGSDFKLLNTDNEQTVTQQISLQHMPALHRDVRGQKTDPGRVFNYVIFLYLLPVSAVLFQVLLNFFFFAKYVYLFSMFVKPKTTDELMQMALKNSHHFY